MNPSWREPASEQLLFWTNLLGQPDEFDVRPGGLAIWEAVSLRRATFLQQPIPWIRLTITDKQRPLIVDMASILAASTENILIKTLGVITYNSANAIITFIAIDSTNLVAQMYIIARLESGEDMNRAAGALDDADRVLRLSMGGESPSMDRVHAYYLAFVDRGKAKSTREQMRGGLDFEDNEMHPNRNKPPVRLAPLNQPRTTLEARRSGASGTIADSSDKFENMLAGMK